MMITGMYEPNKKPIPIILPEIYKNMSSTKEYNFNKPILNQGV